MGIDALMAMTFEPVVVPLESTPQTLGLYRVLSSDVVSGDYFVENSYHYQGNSDFIIFWLVVEPTHLKNMLVKLGSSSPIFG